MIRLLHAHGKHPWRDAGRNGGVEAQLLREESGEGGVGTLGDGRPRGLLGVRGRRRGLDGRGRTRALG